MALQSMYRLDEKLSLHRNSALYRGTRRSDALPCLLKVLEPEYPSPQDIGRMEKEHEVSRRFNPAGLLVSLELVRNGPGPALILENYPGLPASRMLKETTLDAREFLVQALAVVKALESVHKAGIPHGALEPSSILLPYHRGGPVKLTNLAFPDLPRGQSAEAGSGAMASWDFLAYISPEQTGWVKWQVDFRSDFYSLGAVFYQWLTGRIPFARTDPLELLYGHMAVQPEPPESVNPAVPGDISAVVMKLLLKMPRERYQTAESLARDLEHCRAGGPGAEPASGIRSYPADPVPPTIPQRLYGREREKASLDAAYRRICPGSVEYVLVSGPSGVGKTALAREWRASAAGQGGFFGSGKFDQFLDDSPYHALVQALQEVIAQILAGDELDFWKGELTAALGHSGRLIADLLPDLERIIGPQPPLPEAGRSDVQSHFTRAFKALIRTLAREGCPLVLFLDDLQWADSNSLHLIHLIVTDADTRCLMLIGASREPSDSPQAERGEGRTEPVPTSHVRLEPLDLRDLNHWLAECLACPEPSIRPLGESIFGKTHGNPFFVSEFLKLLLSGNILRFERRVPGLGAEWKWNLEQIGQMGITDNVVEFLIARIKSLAPRTQEILKSAACLGDEFTLESLATVEGTADRELLPGIGEAVAAGFLVRAGKIRATGEFHDAYVFHHDRVRQAAYQLLPEPVRMETHLRIGRRLLESGTAVPESDPFEIANHFNEGYAIIVDPAEKLRIAELLMNAGAKAKAATAYELALKYFRTGLRLLPAGGWRSDYRLTYRLSMQAAECEYLNANFGASEELFNLILQEAGSKLDKAVVFDTKMLLREHLLDHEATMEIGREGLSLLGIRIPAKPGYAALILGQLGVMRRLMGKEIGDLERIAGSLPPEKQAAMNLLVHLWDAAFLAGKEELQGLAVFTMLDISLRYGNSEVSSVAYVCYGVFQSSRFGNFPKGYAFGECAVKMAERFGNPLLMGRVLFIFASFLSHRRCGLSETLEKIRQAFRLSLESGDRVYTGYCNDVTMYLMVSMGLPMGKIKAELEALRAFAKKAENKASLQNAEMMERWISALEGTPEAVDSRLDLHFRFETTLTDKIDRGFFYVCEWQLAYLFRRFEIAAQIPGKLAGNPIIDPSSYFFAYFHFYRSLVLAAAYSAAPEAEKKRLVKMVKAGLEVLRRWSADCPRNYLCKYALVKAELHRVLGEWEEAALHYDQAVAAAYEGGFLQIEAMANESAAEFHLSRGREKVARAYLLDAHHGYRRWGAGAKAKDLERRHPRFFQLLSGGVRPLLSGNRSMVGFGGPIAMDFMALMKASQAISGEIVLPKLLEKLMKIVAEVSGAQKGILIMEKKGRLLIEAEWKGDGSRVDILKSIPVEDSGAAPMRLVNYVARTERMVILPDGNLEAIFAGDPYLSRKKPKSLLAMPLLHQGKLAGVIYLENNLTSGAFTPERQEILKLLGTQAAISLFNADFHAVQMEALQAKINPHFLFNTLSSIAELAVREDPAKVENAVLMLSRLYRYILESTETPTVPLSRELEIVRFYLELEKIRYGAKLDFRIEAGSDLEGVRIPGLIIQPLVENSIRHGIAPKLEGGTVSVLVEAAGGKCRILVADDGVGLIKARPGAAAGTSGSTSDTAGSGHGLKNVRERLSLLFGEGYSMSFLPGEGVSIEISIPLMIPSSAPEPIGPG